MDAWNRVFGGLAVIGILALRPIALRRAFAGFAFVVTDLNTVHIVSLNLDAKTAFNLIQVLYTIYRQN